MTDRRPQRLTEKIFHGASPHLSKRVKGDPSDHPPPAERVIFRPEAPYSVPQGEVEMSELSKELKQFVSDSMTNAIGELKAGPKHEIAQSSYVGSEATETPVTDL